MEVVRDSVYRSVRGAQDPDKAADIARGETDNTQPLCSLCNSRKHKFDYDEFLARLEK